MFDILYKEYVNACSHYIAYSTMIADIKNGLDNKECFSPIISIEELEKIRAALETYKDEIEKIIIDIYITEKAINGGDK